MKKTIGETINELFARPKPATIEHLDEKIEVFIKSPTEEIQKEYERLLNESGNDVNPAIRYLFFNCIVNEDGSPVWDTPESIKLNPEFRKKVLDIVSNSISGIKVSEFAAKNFPDSPSLEAVSK